MSAVEFWPSPIDPDIRRKLREGLRGKGELQLGDVLKLYRDQEGRCAVSGIAFSLEPRITHAFVKHPFAPSVDRIDCQQGYQLGNVRLVLTIINFALGEWGDDVFWTVIQGCVKHGRL